MDMSVSLFIIKKILVFWLCYFAGLFLAEGLVILLHFACGKNIFVGEMFPPETITVITYYGYIIVACVALLYWKAVEKKPLSAMGLSKEIGSYFIGILVSFLLLGTALAVIVMTGSIKYQGMNESVYMPVIILLTGGFMVQGATEEILCRGIVLHALKISVIFS